MTEKTKNIIIPIITATIICLVFATIGYSLNKARFGVEIPSVIALFETSLSSKIASSSTTMTLVSGTDDDGTTLSGKFGFILDEGTNSEEFVIADCVDTACTGLLRGISVVDGQTETSGLKKPHRRGASVKMTNYPILGILQQLASGSLGYSDMLYYVEGLTFTSGTASTSAFTPRSYVDDVGAGGFTASNIETSDGLQALGTSPETVGINLASTSGLYFESGGDLAIYTSTSNPLFIDDDGEVQVSTTASFTFGDLTITRASISDSFTVSDIFHGNSVVLDTALDETYGGTGTTSWDTNDICYISADNTFGAISSGSDGQQLTMTNGAPGWGSSFGTMASSFTISGITSTGTYDATGLANYEVAYVVMTGTPANESQGRTHGFIWRTTAPTSINQWYEQTVDHSLTVAWDDANDEIDYTEGGTQTWEITIYLFK